MLVKVDIKSGVTLSLPREEQNTYHTCSPTPPPQTITHVPQPPPPPLKKTRKYTTSIPSFSAKSIRRGLYLRLTPRVPYGMSTSIFFTDFFKTQVTDLAKKGGTATSNTTSQNIMTDT